MNIERVLKYGGLLGLLAASVVFLYFGLAVEFSVVLPLIVGGAIIGPYLFIMYKYVPSRVDMSEYEFSYGADLTTDVKEDMYVQVIIASVLALLYLNWAINVPGYFEGSATIYFGIVLFGGIVIPLAASQLKRGVSFLGVLGTEDSSKLTNTFIISAASTLVWMLYSAAVSVLAPSSIQIPIPSKGVLYTLAATAWVTTAAFSEEFLFRSTEGAYSCRVMGILPGALVSGLVFSGFHWLVYRSAPQVFTFLFVGGVLMQLIDIHRKSSMPGLAIHLVNNVASTAGVLIGIQAGMKFMVLTGGIMTGMFLVMSRVVKE